jgi:hypothetical protein
MSGGANRQSQTSAKFRKPFGLLARGAPQLRAHFGVVT